MAIFDDPKKELKKLEQQLLQDEEWFDKELEAAKKLSGYAPARQKTSRPAQSGGRTAQGARTQRPLDQTQVYRTGGAPQVRNAANNYGQSAGRAQKPVRKPEPEMEPEEKGVKGLVVCAVVETLGIVGLVAYWVLMIL